MPVPVPVPVPEPDADPDRGSLALRVRAPAPRRASTRRRPDGTLGRRLTRGAALGYLFLLVLLPVGVIFYDALREGPGALVRAVTRPAARHALWLTLWTAGLTSVINAVMGTVTAYVLVRYRFPGRKVLDAIVDIPLAIPTLVTGVMLVVLFGPEGTLGSFLKAELGVKIILAPPGIVIALLFVTFPFVVRSVEPVLESLDPAPEEAAVTLGARAPTVFRVVTWPQIRSAVVGGTLLGFARALGEFGAIVVVAGNIPLRTETAAVYVLGELESENRLAASAMSIVLVGIAFAITLVAERLAGWRAEAAGGGGGGA